MSSNNWKTGLPPNIGAAVRKFQEAAGDTVDELNIRQMSRYTGMQCEELAEKLALLSTGSSQASRDLASFAGMLDQMGEKLKSGVLDIDIARAMADDTVRADVVDADIDLSWVSFGSLNSIGADVFACVDSVATANLSKIGPDGVVLRDANGKIKKPPGWTEPDHVPNLYPVAVVAGEPITTDAKSKLTDFGKL